MIFRLKENNTRWKYSGPHEWEPLEITNEQTNKRLYSHFSHKLQERVLFIKAKIIIAL